MIDSPPPPQSPPSARRRLILALAALAGLVILVVLIKWWLAPAGKPAAARAVPVGVAAVKLGDMNVYLDELGTVTPVYTVTVTSRVAGELVEVHYKEGQIVKKGDTLAVIDPRPYQAVVLQAEGQLERDVALLKNAKIDLARYQEAYKVHAVPEQQVATQQALVEQDEGTARLDQGNLDAARVNVVYTRIVSPIDGRVGLRLVDPGNIVPANGTTGIATITQLQPITVIFTIAEDDLSRVVDQISSGARLQVDALDRTQRRKLAAGTLLAIDNQVNTATGTVRIRATFPNTHNELFPNQFVNARLQLKTLSQVALIPDAAIQRNNDITFVYVIQPDNTVQSRNVTVLATEGGASAVSGVVAGDQVVTDGFDKLTNGTAVAVRQPPAAPAQGGGGVKKSG